MQVLIKSVVAACLLGVAVFGYTQVMARIGFGTPPQLAAEAEQADLIRVSKSKRTLTLLRNENSVTHLTLHFSYPDVDDTARAVARGVSPGGQIVVHGRPHGCGVLGRSHIARDRTNACNAVTNAKMKDIWSQLPNATKIVIEG